MDSKLINVTGLWKHPMKDGGTYLAGSLGNLKVLIFVNTKKQAGSKQPDYTLCFAPQEPKEKKADDPGSAQEF